MVGVGAAGIYGEPRLPALCSDHVAQHSVRAGAATNIAHADHEHGIGRWSRGVWCRHKKTFIYGCAAVVRAVLSVIDLRTFNTQCVDDVAQCERSAGVVQW